MTGFVTDYAYTLGWQSKDPGWSVLPGTTASEIMGCFTPAALPVLSALATGYAVCDYWFASVPTETMPNRAFTCAGTSMGQVDDNTKTFSAPSIFGALGKAGQTWAIYGYNQRPLSADTFTDVATASGGAIGLFTDFQAAAAAGTLPDFTFLEPSWPSTGNSQHPNYNVALGEQLIHDVYEALRSGPGWAQTLFVLTYDEHGGCFDHVPPPWGATPPDSAVEAAYDFTFNRFGVRVPTVLISPLIAPGTVYRVPGRLHPARPHVDPRDRRAALGPAPADRPRRRRPRVRRRAHPRRPPHRRRPRRGDGPGRRQRGPLGRPGLAPGGHPPAAARQHRPGRRPVRPRHPPRPGSDLARPLKKLKTLISNGPWPLFTRPRSHQTAPTPPPSHSCQVAPTPPITAARRGQPRGPATERAPPDSDRFRPFSGTQLTRSARASYSSRRR